MKSPLTSDLERHAHGVKYLLEKAGVIEKDIDLVIITGAFGSYLDVQSAIDIVHPKRLYFDVIRIEFCLW